MIEEKRKKYRVNAYKVILMLRKDMFKIYNEVTDKFLWRNFSKYVYLLYFRASSQAATFKE